MIPKEDPAKARGPVVRVWVVDDEPRMRSMLRRVVRAPGREVCTFPAARACSACACRPGEVCADIVLSDLQMPGLGGIDFVARQRRVGCPIRAIGLMSGSWTEAERQRATALGCAVFEKPFDPLEVREWVDRCSARISATRQLESRSALQGANGA